MHICLLGGQVLIATAHTETHCTEQWTNRAGAATNL